MAIEHLKSGKPELRHAISKRHTGFQILSAKKKELQYLKNFDIDYILEQHYFGHTETNIFKN